MSSKQITGGFQGRWYFWALLLLGLLASGCNSSLGPTSPAVSDSPAEIEFQLLSLTNSARSAAGAEPPLASDPRLTDVARSHSRAMRDLGFIGHEGPDGKGLRDRLEEAGIEFSRAAENLAQITNSADPSSLAHDLLMDSARHRDNILDDRFEYVGIGVVTTNDTVWITQIFIKP